MINPQNIEHLKKNTDLVAYMAGRGIKLSQNGRSHKALCPFHEETTPSFTVTPSENLWHCFGCGAGGDIFNFVEQLDKVGFTKAVKIIEKVAAATPKIVSAPVSASQAPLTPPLTRPAATLSPGGRGEKVSIDNRVEGNLNRKLLNRVVQFYQQELYKDHRGLNYLKSRGLSDKQALTDFGVGFVNGNLLEALPSDGDYEAALKQMGIINERGHEMFFGCVVFPLLDSNSNCVGLYGRRIDEEQVKHLYLPGPRRGLINSAALKRSKTLFLTESIIDALTLYSNGFKNVIPLYGVNGWTDDHAKLFTQYTPDNVYICFDSDEAGVSGAIAVKEKIRSAPDLAKTATGQPKIHIIKLPVKDLNDYFRKYRPDEFESLITAAHPKSVESSENHFVKDERFYESTEYGFIVAYGKREYEIKGIARMGTQLKATIKASLDIKGTDKFQITTLDLYSLRSREGFAKAVAQLTGERLDLCLEDLNRILTKLENYQPGKPTKPEEKVMTEAQKKEALTFLRNPNLLQEVLKDIELLGCTGEETNKLVAYLVATSRKMEDPLSLLIQSRSAAGKSTLQDAILALIPEEETIKYTRLTDQALYYKDENSLVHKLLAIEEASGIGGSAYSIRALQSSKQLTVATTSKDNATGKMKTEEYQVKGPLAIMLTTTAIDLDAEMESRFLTITIDESTAMTEKIHQKQRMQDTLEGYLARKRSDTGTNKHQNAQTLLQPLVVINPYAPYLNFPSENLRSRRDHKKYLTLIKTITFLHQYQRDIKEMPVENIKYIEVTLDDIACANKLAHDVLGKSLDDLAASSRTLLNIIHSMVTQKCKENNLSITDFSFNRRMIREFAKWSDWQVKYHIKELEDLGFVYSRMGSKGKEYIYELHHEVPDQPTKKVYLGLTPISQLEKIKSNLEGVSKHLVAL